MASSVCLRGVLVCAVLLLSSGCGERAPREASFAVVYGEDDREDVYAYADRALAEALLERTVTLVPLDALTAVGDGTVRVDASTLDELGVCADERFVDQPVAGTCSGVLIADDLVLTAGHCVLDEADCGGYAFVFGYAMQDATALATLPAENVFGCGALVARADGYDRDAAIVALDRATGRTPATLPREHEVAIGDALVVAGAPMGLPVKIDDGGRVRHLQPQHGFFVANLDTFGGNSGSGVYDRATGGLLGILVRGVEDHVFDEARGCLAVRRCPEDGCDGEEVLYLGRALEVLCASGHVSDLCPCGDGACDPARDETTATCPVDCGVSCGDAACNGDETPLACPVDCGTCGNGACDEDPLDCCTDCGCGTAFACAQNACVPLPEDGDACTDVAELVPRGHYTIEGDTRTADPSHRVCGFSGTASGRDRVYAFTLSEPTLVRFTMPRTTLILGLRGADCDLDDEEIACSNDVLGVTELGRFLPAGRYHLVVDELAPMSAPYAIDVSFEPFSPAANDTCAGATPIPAAGVQTFTGELRLTNARDDYASSCGGAGLDRVYSFTLDRAAAFHARCEGADTLYLRRACDDASDANELACSDTYRPHVGVEIDVPRLEPGTYHVVVDRFALGLYGPYWLTVGFSCAHEDGGGDEDCEPGAPDGGTEEDAGAPTEGGTEEDAGAPMDGGAEEDGGVADAGRSDAALEDAGTPPDATRSDAGMAVGGGGCAASRGASSSAAGLVLIAVALVLGRRARR